MQAVCHHGVHQFVDIEYHIAGKFGICPVALAGWLLKYQLYYICPVVLAGWLLKYQLYYMLYQHFKKEYTPQRMRFWGFLSLSLFLERKFVSLMRV